MPSSRPPISLTNPRPSRWRVLIADDHPVVRRGLRVVLEEDETLEVVAEVADGGEAWRQIQALKPQVALLDFTMPKLNGLEVARKMKEAKLPVASVLMTMHKEEDLFNEAIDAGVLGFVLKENATDELLQAVRAAVAGCYFVSQAIAHFLLRRHQRGQELAEHKPGLKDLSLAERQILRMVADGRTSKEIAEGLRLSPRTVDNHRFHIAAKLDLHGTHSLVKFAYENKSKL